MDDGDMLYRTGTYTKLYSSSQTRHLFFKSLNDVYDNRVCIAHILKTLAVDVLEGHYSKAFQEYTRDCNPDDGEEMGEPNGGYFTTEQIGWHDLECAPDEFRAEFDKWPESEKRLCSQGVAPRKSSTARENTS